MTNISMFLSTIAVVPYGMGEHHWLSGWGILGIPLGILGGMIMLGFWILIIVGVIYLIKYLAHGGMPPGEDKPLNIIKERYARGEITKEEYDRMKEDLGK